MLRGVFVFAHDGERCRFSRAQADRPATGDGIWPARGWKTSTSSMNFNSSIRISRFASTNAPSELHRAARALEIEIAERRRAEEVVAGERHRLHSVVEHLPEGVIVLDAEQRIVLANSAAGLRRALIGPVAPGSRLESIAGRASDRLRIECRPNPSGWRWSPNSNPSLVFEVAVRRVEGRDARLGRRAPRHLRPAQGGGTTSPAGTNRRHGAPRRRHRPRLQQSHPGRHDPCRKPAPRRGRRPRTEKGRRPARSSLSASGQQL